jgi:hypothetical protein
LGRHCGRALIDSTVRYRFRDWPQFFKLMHCLQAA